MKIERPQFELTRVCANGTRDVPEIVPVSQMPWETKMERRGFLGVGVGVASVLALSESACSSTEKGKRGRVTAKIPAKLLKAHTTAITALTISDDGEKLASGSWDAIKCWSLSEDEFLPSPWGRRGYVLAISRDGKILASGYEDDSKENTVRLWSSPDNKLFATLEGHKNYVHALAISSDGKTLASGSYDNTVKLWSLPAGKLLATLKDHKTYVRALAVSPNGKTLASGFGDYAIKLWSLPDGKLISTLSKQQAIVSSLTISPDGKTLASGFEEGTIKLLSLPGGELITRLEGHKNTVSALSISPDGRTLASGVHDGVIILWDIEKHFFLASLFDLEANPRTSGSGSGYGGGGGGGVGGCTCDKVCVCIPVPSDLNAKEAFETTDPLLILQRLSELPIQTWNYKWNDAAIRHIGPMAQDFAAAFRVGEDDKHICPVDAQGVAFAAIQGLYRIVREKEVQTESLQAQLQHQQAENQALRACVEALEHLAKDVLGVREEARAEDKQNESWPK